MMPDWAAQNGGFNLEGVTVFTLGVVPLNHHPDLGLQRHPRQPPARRPCPRLDQHLRALPHEDVSGLRDEPVNLLLGVGTFAVLLFLLTRGRLGYDKYLAEVRNPGR